MGSALALALLEKGRRVTGYDVRPEPRQALEAAGGRWAESPAEAARDASILVLMVVNAEQAEAALAGPGGALGTLPRGAVVVLHSTVPPAFARSLAARIEAGGHLFLDAPVSGGVSAARKGALSVMASGSTAAFAAAKPELDGVASRVFEIGREPGQGSVVKTVNQLLAGAHIAVAAEAVAFGASLGVDTQVLYDVITHCAGSSWMFANRVPHMIEGDYTPLSAVNIFVKDLGIVLDSAKERGFPTPMASQAHTLFLAAAAAGHAREDDAAVVKVYEKLAGVSVRRSTPAAGN